MLPMPSHKSNLLSKRTTKFLRQATFLPFLIAAIVCACPLYGSVDLESDASRLKGKAEDLWGNQVTLSRFAKGITLIHPFSPANCGWCLVDGEFVKENYFRNNEEAGGTNFLQCPFNPQLDIYTYQKHYRECSTPVLTFPLTLHRYHGDGFPFLIAFQDGALHYSDIMAPYEEIFRQLSPQLWPGKRAGMLPTSDFKMAGKFVYENEAELAIEIYSAEDKAGVMRVTKRLEDDAKRDGKASGRLKFESQLTEADYQMNLCVAGITEQFELKFLKSDAVPIHFDAEDVVLGDHRFPKSEVGISACFPNPHNTERYVVLHLAGSKLKVWEDARCVDYMIYKNGADGRLEILLEGLFEKDRDNWRFSSALAYGTATGKNPLCTKLFCPLPSKSSGKGEEKPQRPVRVSSWVNTPLGRMKTLGAGSCRFPSLTVDDDGICWAAWEEDGDIHMASLNHPERQIAVAVESDSSDSFNPVLAYDGSVLWVFYLNDRDRFYRLCARYLDGGRLSDEILLSERGPFDVITPGAASDRKGKLVITWTEWKANFRYLKFREMYNRNLGDIKYVTVKEADGYVNAWCPSLVMDKSGQPWGAWNQHYPAILGVCAGNLVDEAGSVTSLSDDIDKSENGGYPSIVLDGSGKKWVFWETFAWDVLDSETPQRIHGSWYDEANARWSLPYKISSDEQAMLNQTPQAAADGSGAIWIAWSGRRNDIREPWGIRLARFDNGRSSTPQLVSGARINARAPAIAIGKDDTIWLAWHSGIGSQMQIKVLEYHPQGRNSEKAQARTEK